MRVELAAAAPLRVLIVDDEAPARQRLRDLLGDVADACPHHIVALAGNGVEALQVLEQVAVDVALIDVRMPEMDGVELARHLSTLSSPPAVIFVTAYEQYAVEAFELAAVDYLLKPVRAERLAAALQRLRTRGKSAAKVDAAALAALTASPRRHFSIHQRGRILLVPVEEVIYFKAELKYVSLHTASAEYLLEESLTRLEEEFGTRLLRIHRNCLVSRAAVCGAERDEAAGADAPWQLRLRGLDGMDGLLPVSRRQWPQVRQALGL